MSRQPAKMMCLHWLLPENRRSCSRRTSAQSLNLSNSSHTLDLALGGQDIIAGVNKVEQFVLVCKASEEGSHRPALWAHHVRLAQDLH